MYAFTYERPTSEADALKLSEYCRKSLCEIARRGVCGYLHSAVFFSISDRTK